MRFLGAIRSPAQIAAEVLPQLMTCQERHPGFGYWAARERGREELTGWFGLRPLTPGSAAINHWAEAAAGEVAVAGLGYRLRRSAWGRGYATEGARALVRRAFTDLGVSRVVATTMAVNNRSRRVLEKAGPATRGHSTWTGRTRCRETSTETSSTNCAGTTGSRKTAPAEEGDMRTALRASSRCLG
jgi:RimJ/RimL family protein N-acetyltransferase